MYHGEKDYRHGSPEQLGILLVNLGTPDEPTAPALRRYLAESWLVSRIMLPSPAEELDLDHAEALVGAEIWVPRDALPPPRPGEYYWVDLEGLHVVGADGFAFGRVSHLFSTGSNDVMSVIGERERLIPFLRDDVVKRVDLDAGLIEVDWDPEF